MHRTVVASLLMVSAALAGGCGTERADGSAGDADALEEARALLDSDRPWSAARRLRQIETDGLGPETRVVAARAEAAVGGWERVRTLLSGLDSLSARDQSLLARAQDETGNADAALQGYDAFLADADASLERAAIRLRRALLLTRLDPAEGARALAEADEVPADWRAVLEAEALARTGATDRVETLAQTVSSGLRGQRMWAARIEAARQSGDLDMARNLAERARAAADSGPDRAQFAMEAGRLADTAGDNETARTLFRAAIDADPASPAARRAAALLRQRTPTPADWLAIARTDRALGLNTDAADAFGRWLAADMGTPAQQADIRYEAADALFDGQQYDQVEAMLRPIRDRTDARELWAGALGRMGRTDDAAALYLDLANTDPAPNLYFAADVLHQGGDLGRALALYQQVEREHAGTRWASLATLRRAGQAFQDGDYAQAARLWDGYQGDARHALRARYWAGRAHAEAGDSAAATERFRDVIRRDRDSYYALLASQALGDPFWPVPMAASPPHDPDAAARAAQTLRGVDVLRAAGFPDAAEAEVDRAIARASRGQADRYALAEALVERGYGRRAILLGQSLGGGTNERKLRILYPFPFRRMITAEAQANGVDPFVAAALIRQESQFSQRATSHVGARGLMQLMPATGRTLAQEVGIEDWDPALLYLPEVNVHLGTRYVGQQAAAYDGSLPAIFGAYNAGPHQVDAWRAFPEFGRDALFAERIPFRETRDYVKILTRNRAIYAGLYGR